MPRRDSLPSYRRHRPTGQAVVTLTSPDGTRRDYYLGPYGSQQSKREYARIIGEWNAAGRSLHRIGPTLTDLTVNELLLAFWTHAQGRYRQPDGTSTSELESFRYTLRPVKELYGHTLARDFTPLALKAVRQKMVEAGLSRRVVNQRVSRIKYVFKWAVSETLVDAVVFQALATVEGLKQGRTDARESAPIEPVSDDDVEATLAKLNRHVAGMVRFQRLTGCRPQDVCNLRRCDIDTTGEIWFYRPPQHKNAWRGKDRVIAIGPKAQAVLAEFPTEDPTDYVFSPARMMVERMKMLRDCRRTPVQPSQLCRAASRPRRKPGWKYTPNGYRLAVIRAAALAGVSHWHPNQLRHSRGTEVRKQFGLEAAQVVLGHQKASTTEIYAQSNAALAAQIAKATG